jgi:Methyltransferase domain
MSYADLSGQRSMAFDAVRNAAYAQAIERIVTPDSVVLDLGAGLGIHALIAARAGARRVFMVEPENVVHCAMEVARHAGYGDRIEAFRGRIEEIELPEKVDVIVSVFTGNLLYSEDLLPSLYFARDRWLKSGGHLIPDRAELMVAPLSAPGAYREHIESWSEPHLGFDYSLLRRYAANAILSDPRNSDRRSNARLLAPATAVETVDLTTASSTSLDARADFVAAEDGLCHGLHAWIRIRTGEQWLATGPIEAPTHWTPHHLCIDPPLQLQAGSTVTARIRRPAHGEWTWEVSVDREPRKQSTFLGLPLRTEQLLARSPSAKAKLSTRGRVRKFVLNHFNGVNTNSEIARLVMSEHPTQFEDFGAALRFVSDLAGQNG